MKKISNPSSLWRNFLLGTIYSAAIVNYAEAGGGPVAPTFTPDKVKETTPIRPGVPAAHDEKREPPEDVIAAQKKELESLRAQLARMQQQKEAAPRAVPEEKDDEMDQELQESASGRTDATLAREERMQSPSISASTPPLPPAQSAAAPIPPPQRPGLNAMWGQLLGPQVENFLNTDGKNFEKAIGRLFGRRE